MPRAVVPDETMRSAWPGPAPSRKVLPAIWKPRLVRLVRISPDPLPACAWLSSASRRNWRSMSLPELLKSR